MSVVTVVVRGLCDGKEMEVPFTVTQQRLGDADKAVRSIVSSWHLHDKVTHTVTSAGKTLGQRITVQLAATTNKRRDNVDKAVRCLKRSLEFKGLSVNPAQSHDYSDFERNADIGLRV
jgi:hypothetical protein